MALVVCRECAGKVSDEAPFCPHCGIEIRADKFQKVEIDAELPQLEALDLPEQHKEKVFSKLDNKHSENGSKLGALVGKFLLLNVLIFFFPSFFPKSAVLIAMSWITIIGLILVKKVNSPIASYILLLKVYPLRWWHLLSRFVMSTLILLLAVATIAINQELADQNARTDFILEEAKEYESKGLHDKSLSVINSIDISKFNSDNATKISVHKEQLVRTINKDKLTKEHSDKLSLMLKKVNKNINENDLKSAYDELSSYKNYQHADSYKEAQKLFKDLEKASDENFIAQYLTSISDKEWKSISSKGVLSHSNMFETEIVNNSFFENLNYRFSELGSIREKEIKIAGEKARIAEEMRLEKIREQQVLEDKRKKKNALIAKQLEEERKKRDELRKRYGIWEIETVKSSHKDAFGDTINTTEKFITNNAKHQRNGINLKVTNNYLAIGIPDLSKNGTEIDIDTAKIYFKDKNGNKDFVFPNVKKATFSGSLKNIYLELNERRKSNLHQALMRGGNIQLIIKVEFSDSLEKNFTIPADGYGNAYNDLY